MQIYEGYYSDKRYQFIYSTDEIKEKVKSIFEHYEIEKVVYLALMQDMKQL